MYILGIETTGKYASVSLLDLDSNEILLEKSSGEERSHLKGLIPMIDSVLHETGVKKSEIKYIACSTGPGSFTGIRIGVATARALAQGLGVLVIPVPTLDAFMYKEGIEKEKCVAPIIYARRGQVYASVLSDGKYLLEPGPYMLDDILEITKGVSEVTFLGDGTIFYSDRLKDPRFKVFPSIYQDSKSVLKYAKDNLDKAVSYNELLPLYMRITEAEAKLNSGELKITKMRQD